MRSEATRASWRACCSTPWLPHLWRFGEDCLHATRLLHCCQQTMIQSNCHSRASRGLHGGQQGRASVSRAGPAEGLTAEAWCTRGAQHAHEQSHCTAAGGAGSANRAGPASYVGTRAGSDTRASELSTLCEYPQGCSVELHPAAEWPCPHFAQCRHAMPWQGRCLVSGVRVVGQHFRLRPVVPYHWAPMPVASKTSLMGRCLWLTSDASDVGRTPGPGQAGWLFRFYQSCRTFLMRWATLAAP